jgi:hypothetical protein
LRYKLMIRLARLFDIARFERRPWGQESRAFFHLASCRAALSFEQPISRVTAHLDEISVADCMRALKQIPAMTVLGDTPTIAIAGLFPTFTSQ